ncbi:exocyst complex component sec15 subunit [Sistotremastrum niveocremeum HHB9708]|uniref:Exocyst complex component SEC15 n=1 Tax=Sistotremastrum niveocremeum HHB9708 TaxID=1314777 RepID=A0A164ZT75_9AGAM|nr:exocyst complex component sec15 subunit [Sistotremastrum niveocremeum HHB9708]
MPPRKRPNYTVESIDQQLQQIHLLDSSSSSENLEQLAPIIKQIHAARHQEAYLKIVQALVETKEAEIEKICGDNYQDFVSSVSTLLTVRKSTHNLRDKITTLDSSVSSVGNALASEKRALLRSKQTASNLDSAIDALQGCLKILDLVHRVEDMIKEQKYWSALRSIEEIQNLPPSSLSHTSFFAHILSSLPSLRSQIKDAVAAANKSWLLEIRNVSGQVGKLALETMENRTRRWRTRQERDPHLRSSRVGTAVEMVSNERIEVDVLDNEKLRVDFKPLYQAIHIYTALDALDELQKSYQADRKAQATLILPTMLQLSSLSTLLQEVAGFFIVENHVLRTSRGFRSERTIEELWEEALRRVSEGVQDALARETDLNMFLKVKDCLSGFGMTMSGYGFSTQSLHSTVLSLFEKYVKPLEREYAAILENLISRDELVPMRAEDVVSGSLTIAMAKDNVVAAVIIRNDVRNDLQRQSTSLFPWSKAFYSCSETLRKFIPAFYEFVDGVDQHYRDIDEILAKSLDNLLAISIVQNLVKRIDSTSSLSQIAMVATDLEYFQMACDELERTATSYRTSQRQDAISLPRALEAIASAPSRATNRIEAVISSKLNDFLELSEYNFTPKNREDMPSMYLYEMVNWLTTVVDSLAIQERYKDEAYKSAIDYVAERLTEFLVDKSIPIMNENAISNLMVDVDFLRDEFRKIGRDHLVDSLNNLRLMMSIPLSNTVQDYLHPNARQVKYASVQPKMLAALLEKLGKYGTNTRDQMERQKGDKRMKEAELVGRLYPGSNR